MHFGTPVRGARTFAIVLAFVTASAVWVAVPSWAAGPLGSGGPVGSPVAPAPKAPTVTPQAPMAAPVLPTPLLPQSAIPAVGGPTGTTTSKSGDGSAPGIVDPTSTGIFDRWGELLVTAPSGTTHATTPIPDVAVTVNESSGGTKLHLTTDSKGVVKLDKLTPGTYVLELSSKDLNPALDRVALKQTSGAGSQPQPIIAVLIGLLLPAVQKSDVAPTSSTTRAFARGTADQALRLSLMIPKTGGTATIDWGDGHGPIPLGLTKIGTGTMTLTASFTATVSPTTNNTYTGATNINAGTLTSYLRLPEAETTSGKTRATTPLPGVRALLIRKSSGRPPLEYLTDAKGSFTTGKLTPGTYTLEFSGSSIEPVLDKITTVQPIAGSVILQPHEVLIALLLPAVQKAREASNLAPVPTTIRLERAFARGKADQVIHVTLTIPQGDGATTIDWGDGSGPTNVSHDDTIVKVGKGGAVTFRGMLTAVALPGNLANNASPAVSPAR